jgi:hypothetical protein
VVWPAESVPAVIDGGALLTVTVGLFTAVLLVLVATVKLKLALAVAVNVTVTVAPAVIAVQKGDVNVIVSPLLFATVPEVPAWRHEPEIRATVDGLIVDVTPLLAVESPIVIVFPVARAATATKVTV